MRLRTLFAAALITVGMAAGAVPAQAVVPTQTLVPITSASGIHIVGHGTTSTGGGWVAFTGSGDVSVAVGGKITTSPGTVSTNSTGSQQVGGGTWNYGSYGTWYGTKFCYSDFLQNYRTHSSAAKMGNGMMSSRHDAGDWTHAYVEAYTTNTCFAYWDY